MHSVCRLPAFCIHSVLHLSDLSQPIMPHSNAALVEDEKVHASKGRLTSLIAAWPDPSSSCRVAFLKSARPSIGKYSLFSSASIMRFSAYKRYSTSCCRPATMVSSRGCATRLSWASQSLLLYLLDNIKNIWLQVFSTVGSNSQVQLVW